MNWIGGHITWCIADQAGAVSVRPICCASAVTAPFLSGAVCLTGRMLSSVMIELLSSDWSNTQRISGQQNAAVIDAIVINLPVPFLTEVTPAFLLLVSLRYSESIMINYDEPGPAIGSYTIIADQHNRRPSSMILDKSDALDKIQ